MGELLIDVSILRLITSAIIMSFSQLQNNISFVLISGEVSRVFTNTELPLLYHP